MVFPTILQNGEHLRRYLVSLPIMLPRRQKILTFIYWPFMVFHQILNLLIFKLKPFCLLSIITFWPGIHNFYIDIEKSMYCKITILLNLLIFAISIYWFVSLLFTIALVHKTCSSKIIKNNLLKSKEKTLFQLIVQRFFNVIGLCSVISKFFESFVFSSGPFFCVAKKQSNLSLRV